MEFNEKLQQLRKQNNLTQEQLAEKLFVSRTAISKWESGKGYPNIESLKSISQLFSVSIDELLSGEELICLAEEENSTNLKLLFGRLYAVLDLSAIAFIFLPLYGKTEGNHIYAVNLLSPMDTSQLNQTIYGCIFILLLLLGMMQLLLSYFKKEKAEKMTARASYFICCLALCFFAAAREPYVTVLLFLVIMAKTVVKIKTGALNKNKSKQ